MRIAYYGLSSPIFYDYKIQVEQTRNDTSDSPNPVLDSGFGAVLLFDELWFFCKSLCPQNMRHLPYVKFLDDFYETSELANIDIEKIRQALGGEDETNMRKNKLQENFTIYRQIVTQVGIKWESAADNHTHRLSVGGRPYNGNSMRADNILFDLATVEILKRKYRKKSIELITNSFTQSYLESPGSVLAQSSLTELLILENIPGYLTQQGPYHECIEEVRENSYLKSYREWVSKLDLKYDPKELKDVKKEVENVIANAQKSHFLGYLDPESTFNSVTKTIVGAVADTIIPLSSTIVSIREDLREKKEKKKIMWQGFIITAKDQVK